MPVLRLYVNDTMNKDSKGTFQKSKLTNNISFFYLNPSLPYTPFRNKLMQQDTRHYRAIAWGGATPVFCPRKSKHAHVKVENKNSSPRALKQ